MAQRISPEQERLLADRLRREAEASRPEFSDALHAKICQAVERSSHRPLRRRETSGSARRSTYVAVAVAVLVSATLVVWQAIPRSAPTGVPPEVAESVSPKVDVREPSQGIAFEHIENLNRLVETLDGAPQRFDRTVESALIAGPWGGLDHDVRLVTSMVTEPLRLDLLASAEEAL